MDKIILRHTGVYDGEYDFDGAFTNHEAHVIKKISGLAGIEIQEGFAKRDNDLLVAFATVAVSRKEGRDVDPGPIWAAPAGDSIEVVFGVDEEEEALPPSTGLADAPSEPSPNEPSGPASDETSDIPASDPSSTGTPDSDTGAE